MVGGRNRVMEYMRQEIRKLGYSRRTEPDTEGQSAWRTVVSAGDG